MNGLTAKQVAQKQNEQSVNRIPHVKGRTGFDILKRHLLTYFNFLSLVLFVLLIITGTYRNTLFMGVVVSNAVIGICQEFYLKHKLSVLKKERRHFYTVLRDGKKIRIDGEEIVTDETIFLQAGDQVPCDVEICSTDYLEVNESLMTGESDPIGKQTGDSLVGGSFLISGNCVGRAIRVGSDTHYAKMIARAGSYQAKESQVLQSIEKVIRVMSLMILPLGVVLFLSTIYRDGVDWRTAIISTSAGIIGMIPSGLYLITTVTAGTSVLKLARKKAVVNDFSAVECLSRVTTLCLDKTGTLTTGELKLSEVISYDCNTPEILRLFCKTFSSKNATLKAVFQSYGDQTSLAAEEIQPFSSQRKYAQIQSDGICYRLGAPERLVQDKKVSEIAESKRMQGKRVLFLTKNGDCMAILVMTDVLKQNAKEVLSYFRNERVDLKIISGDHPQTVSVIAGQLGFSDAEYFVDLSKEPANPEHYLELVKRYSVFGRVTPETKAALIRALHQSGETVAMIGDGVNDVSALKEADLSIAMANGDQAAKAVAQILLTESDFAPVAEILREGRRIVNNIRRVAGLYLLKTGFSLLLTVLFILLGTGYPFAPIHMTVIGALAIGIPSFFLALQPDDRPISGEFLPSVFGWVLPYVVLIVLFVGFFGILEKVGYLAQKETLSFYLVSYFCFCYLLQCSSPLNFYKVGIILGVLTAFFVCLFLPGFLALSVLSFGEFLLLGACLFTGSVLLGWYERLKPQEREEPYEKN